MQLASPDKIIGMLCLVLRAGLLLGLAACAQRRCVGKGRGATDTAKDEAECGAQACQEASRRLPYGNGPPLLRRL